MLAPIQCFDFIPNWLIGLYSLALFISFFIKVPEFLSFPIAGFFSFQLLREFAYNLQPESAVGFLNLILLIKFLSPKAQKETQYILGFLWVGTFALFNTNIYYLAYLFISLLLIIYMYPFKMDAPFSLQNLNIDKKFLYSLLKALPLIALLFFIFPRLYGFLPSANKAIAGKIGYSTKINNSTIESLQLNGQIAFYAEMKKRLSTEQLYWRGRVHTYTDGYNWKQQDGFINRNKLKISKKGEEIKYQLKYEQDFDGDLILLDTPITILDANLRYYEEKKYKTFRTYQTKKKATINALSKINAHYIQKTNKNDYTQLPKFRPNLLKEVFQKVKDSNPERLINKFKQYLIKEKYTYSLSPGRLSSMGEFITKKIGYCTHYASLLGILLRMNGTPARLVSGFQGAEYNSVGQYYIIRSNDAHAWVEYNANGNWKRVDPTEFISPLRIIRGGNEFLNSNGVIESQGEGFNSLSFIKKYFDTINYKLALFMDNFDRDSQSEIAKIFNLSLRQFYFYGALLIFITVFLFFMRKRKQRKGFTDEVDQVFNQFEKKLKKHGVALKKEDTITEIQSMLQKLSNTQLDKKLIKDFLETYQKSRYTPNKDIDRLKSMLKSF